MVAAWPERSSVLARRGRRGGGRVQGMMGQIKGRWGVQWGMGTLELLARLGGFYPH